MDSSSVHQSPVRFGALPSNPIKDDAIPQAGVIIESNNSALMRKSNSSNAITEFTSHLSLLQTSYSTLTKLDSIRDQFRLYELVARVCEEVITKGSAGKIWEENCSSPATKRKVYQMSFEVITHVTVIEELINESSFYGRNFSLSRHHYLVVVMAYFFQKEKFSLRLPQEARENIPGTVLSIFEALWQHKIKLGAVLARMRVERNALSVSQLLPVETRGKYLRAQSEPHYARVNLAKVSDIQVEVIEKLCNDGFSTVDSKDNLLLVKKAFYHGCKDLLAFSPDCRGLLDDNSAVQEGLLVLQDFASYKFVEDVKSFLEGPSNLDVVLTNPGSGTELMHIAEMLKDTGALWVYGVAPEQREQLIQRLGELELDNVILVEAPFTTAAPDDDNMVDITTIICMPPSTLSVPNSPVDFIMQEGDHVASHMLKFCDTPISRMYSMEQTELLVHALTFGQCRRVVYATRSVHDSENGSVVGKALERHRELNKDGEYKLSVSQEQGFYTVATFNKGEKPAPPPKDVIAKAVAMGILDGSGIVDQPRKRKKHKKPKRVFTCCEGIPMTIAAQKKVVQKKSTIQLSPVFRF